MVKKNALFGVGNAPPHPKNPRIYTMEPFFGAQYSLTPITADH